MPAPVARCPVETPRVPPRTAERFSVAPAGASVIVDTVFTLGGLLPRAPARTPSARQGTALALEGLTFAAPGAPAGSPAILEGFDAHVRAGELVVLAGPSGCGKSTLLNLVAGLLAPTTGRIRSDGRDVRGAGHDRALVFQEAALFPWLTLRQNVEFPLKVQGFSRAEREARARELLALVHLEGRDGAFPHELSGGMRQRGAIARALATDPAVLLMDEPFAALDPHTRERLQDEVERVWLATGKTIVFVTHSVDEAVRLGDRVLVLGDRPSRVVAEVIVDVERPRVRGDQRLAALAAEVAAALPRARGPLALIDSPDAPGDELGHDAPFAPAAPHNTSHEPNSASSSPRLRVGGGLGAGL